MAIVPFNNRLVSAVCNGSRAARMLFVICLTVVFMAASACASQCGPAAVVTELAEGVFVRQGKTAIVFEDTEVANVGFIVGERCVAVIDTGGSVEEGAALRCAIETRAPSTPVCYVINSHVHPDHLLGNLAFKEPGVEFIGHHKLPRAMSILGGVFLERAEAQAGIKLGPDYLIAPERTVGEEMAFDLGGRILRVKAYPSAHTDHDVSVFDDKTGTLWLADLLFMGHVPVLDASITGWIAVLEELRRLEVRHVVPGHGPVDGSWPEAMTDLLRYLSIVRDETRAAIARGDNLRSAQEGVAYSESPRWQLFDEYHQRNVARAYSELEWED